MKKLVFALALSVAATSVYAQGAKSAHEQATEVVAKMDKAVKLTEEQKKKVMEVNMSVTRRTEIVMTQPANEADRQSALAQIDKHKENQYKTILTAEQYKKWSASNGTK